MVKNNIMDDKLNFMEFLNDIKTKIEYFESLPEDSEERYDIWCELSNGFENGFRHFALMYAMAKLKVANERKVFIVYSQDYLDDYSNWYNRMIYEEFCKNKNKEKSNG